MCLEEPTDDIMEMLTNAARAQNKYKHISKNFAGTNRYDFFLFSLYEKQQSIENSGPEV